MFELYLFKNVLVYVFISLLVLFVYNFLFL